MSEVLILGEVKEGSLDTRTLELLGAGKKLAGEMGGRGFPCCCWGTGFPVRPSEALSYGPGHGL